ncbi:MAG TPA: hemerythrin domain-containing protein [Burkholderiales bacterium]|nr:hemerythrin domain-containing protein [Burkholderiales bacterium]
MANSKSKSKPQDAIAILKADHASVKKAFKQFEKMDQEDVATMKELVTTVCNELTVHTTIEEEIFYPALRKKMEDEDLMNEAQVEHASAKDLIKQLEGMDADDPLYAATFTVLGEYVNHHVEEEEDEMFPQAEKLKLDLEELGRKMLARKEDLMATA